MMHLGPLFLALLLFHPLALVQADQTSDLMAQCEMEIQICFLNFMYEEGINFSDELTVSASCTNLLVLH